MLCDYQGYENWSDYLEEYRFAQYEFNYLVVKDSERAFQETDWCLLRQPFYHRWSRWEHVLAHMPSDEWGTILDWGCGTGEMLSWLKARRPTWIYDGLDIESPHFSYANARGFHAPGSNDTSFGSIFHNYDIITCYETLEHLPDPVHAVDEILSMLTPGGVLLWDFIDEQGGGNVATAEARREVLRILGGTTGQREVYEG